MRRFFAQFMQAVLPARCPISGDIVETPGLVSPAVWGGLDLIDRPYCSCCGLRFDLPVEGDVLCPACLAEPPAYDRGRSVLVYNDVSRDMILAFKHGDQTHLAKSFVPWMARMGPEIKIDGMVVVPVPLHRWRLLARRYNQAGLLAQGIARLWGLGYRPDILLRRRATPSQGHLTHKQRHDNVAGAFICPVDLAGVDVLLVDDVYTTGATVNACARALKAAGARQVNVLTLARVMSAQRI